MFCESSGHGIINQNCVALETEENLNGHSEFRLDTEIAIRTTNDVPMMMRCPYFRISC